MYEIIKKGGFFTVAKAQEFQACLDQANEWISNRQIEVINIETVVLPNIHDELEEGSMDTNLDTLATLPQAGTSLSVFGSRET